MRVVKQVVVSLFNKLVEPLKLKLVLVCSFEKPRLQEEDQFMVKKEGYFHYLNEVITIPTEISEVYDIMQEKIFERIGNFQGEGRGWVFK